jgi:hypothetical protein
MSASQLHKLSREQLYEKVWTTSGVQLSKELGVSDVAIAKCCLKLNIPRPPRGYWAKIEAGQRPKRPSLPPTAEQAFVQEALKPVGKVLELPKDSEAFRPLAADFLKAAEEAKLSYDKKRIHLRESPLPEADISKELAPRVARAFHTLLQVVEPRGIHFRKSQSSYDGGHFRKGNDRLYLKFEEKLVAKTEGKAVRGVSAYRFREEKTIPSGKLTISIKSARYGSSTDKQWMESETNRLEAILAEIAKFICEFFSEAQRRRETQRIEEQKERVAYEIRRKKHQEEEALKRQEEARRNHANALKETAEHRKADLAKAAEWWRLHESIIAFLSECERRWSDAQSGEITDEQRAWLAWAHETANDSSPFEIGYPDPAKDGAFDPLSAPFGGPYPESRQLPKPPSVPEIPAPVVVQQGYGTPAYQPSPKPYPFWLKYQGR